MPGWVAVAVGGALGSVGRYLVVLWAVPISQELPWGTIAINVIGSFVIGFFGTLTLGSGRFPASDWMRLLVMVGFCGGFTTFSSFSLQTLELLRGGAFGRAMANVALSTLLCLGSVALGHVAAQLLNGRTADAAVVESGAGDSGPRG